MDPLSSAGIGLGAVSLTIQVFTGCIKGYQIFADAANVPSQYQHLLTRLRIEQTRLLNWGHHIGLLEASLESASASLGLSYNLVNDVLLEIQFVFRDCIKIQEKFNPFLEQALPILQQHPPGRRSSKQRLLLERALSVTTKPLRVTNRLQWAMVKQDRFKQLVEKMIALNDRVESLLDRTALEEIHTLQVESNMILLQVTNEVSQLRLLVEAFNIRQEPVDHDESTRSLPFWLTSSEKKAENTLASLAQFKVEAALIERDIAQQQPARITYESIVFASPGSDFGRAIGRYQEYRVWLEWREQVEESRPSAHTQSIIHDRVKRLAALLSNGRKPAFFRAPLCLGYMIDDRDEVARYALVYKIAAGSQSEFIGLRTLREAFTTVSMPSLGKRIALATTLAKSLFYLHAVSWLHKGVRSDNILFLRQQYRGLGKDESTAEISSPILSGFDYSRPDLINEQTFRNNVDLNNELYRHPDLLQFRTKRSQKSHDLYSLGIVLFEIAFWKPIEEILGIELRRSRLLEVGLKMTKLNETDHPLRLKLVAQVGEGYSTAIVNCVNGGEGISAQAGLEETDPDVAAQMQQSFFENVVQKLDFLRV